MMKQSPFYQQCCCKGKTVARDFIGPYTGCPPILAGILSRFISTEQAYFMRIILINNSKSIG